MEFKSTKLNGNDYHFLLDARNTRHGFMHICELSINGYHAQTATAYYYNRTWENYRFQSVILSAITQEMEYKKHCITYWFKNEKGYKNITAKRKAELQKEFDNDETLKELTELYNLYK